VDDTAGAGHSVMNDHHTTVTDGGMVSTGQGYSSRVLGEKAE
jgi:hypothetical protein